VLRISKHPFTLKKFVLSVAIIIATLWFIVCLPKPLFDTPYSHILLDKNNNLLQAKIAADGQWRFPYQQNDVPTKFEKAIITFEDKRFYNHFGVDVMALGRALWLNTKHNKVKSGGSTISMQVIRLSRNKPRNVWQKCIELILSVRLEIAYSKQQIIKLYAAHAPFGGNVVGLDAAAWRYFGREASQLSWGEAASLAILPNNPSIVRPGKNKITLLHKRNWLLDQMHNNGVIDKQTCELAKLEPVPDAPLPLPEIAPHALGSLMQKKIHANNNAALITSTLDKHLQQRCNEILFKHAELFASNGIHNAAALIMEVESGDVLAYVGNLYRKNHPDTDPYVDVIPAPRSPGSTLKPLLYAAVLQDGLVLPDALIPDVPTQVAGYSPKNFDLGYDGAVPASKALARSLNVPMVRLLQQYKVERFYDVLKKLNIHSLNKPASHYGLSLILGGGENSMWEISGVYSSLARILNHYTTNSSRYSTNDLRAPNLLRATQHETKDNQYTPNFHVNAGSIYATFNAMNEVMRPGDELLWTQFSSSQKIAWKTGTSFGFRDGWAIGVTPKHVICVWVGNADGEGRPGLTGVNTAAPIMFELFKLLPPSKWCTPTCV
jgi:penicillin-binding protein 1C